MPSDLVQRENGEQLREAAFAVETVRAYQYCIPSTTPEIEAKIRRAALLIKPHEGSFNVRMEHLLHAGMYARTARVAAGMAFTSVMIKIPTVVIISGDCAVHINGEWVSHNGYFVFSASARRIQAYVTFTETEITMLFPSQAKTVEEAEREFTDESDELLSRRSG